MKLLKRLLLNSLILLAASGTGWSTYLTSLSGDYVITKELIGGSGPDDTPSIDSLDYSLSSAAGEVAAGGVLSDHNIYSLSSGYFGGRFGNAGSFQFLSSQVGKTGTKTFYQNHLQVGVPFDAPVQLTFSDAVDPNTLSKNIQAVAMMDHLGNSTGVSVPVIITTDTVNPTVTLQPQTAWRGNTLYDIQMGLDLQNVDGVPLDQPYHVYYLTMLDHREDNNVLDPLTAPNLPASTEIGPIDAMSIHISAGSLANYSAILSNRDPLNAPVRVDPAIIREANAKAVAAGGPYRAPLAVQEINAYDINGSLMTTLTKPASLTIDYGSGLSAPAAGTSLVRPQTLALYVLDQTHRLWVKIPESQNALGGHTLSAPVSQFSVFALMGGADGSASDTYVFPVPWRPHGPNAGTGSGQTGTEADGMTFTNLPSECTIKIYTISGELVRQLPHSDVTGSPHQEKWDGATTHGDKAASGVYLWRVESPVDGKNGKLMIIR